MIELIFYAFAGLLVVGALSVIFATNPVKSILSLVFCFLNAAALLLLTGAEFIAVILIVVYVGAVVVLFLFVVMTLSTEEFDYNKLFTGYYLPFLGGITLSVALAIMSFNIDSFQILEDTGSTVQNTQAIASKLYTDSFLHFQLCGIVLLVALIGTIILSNRQDMTGVKKQNVWKQLTTNPRDRIELVRKISRDGI
jgi:NADH-quinone oxidoreductase subunit J